MKVQEAVRLVQLRIRPAAMEEDFQQAKELVGFVMGIAPSALSIHGGMEVPEEDLMRLGELSDRRLGGEPLQYLLGEWEFMGLPMLTREGVLIPRQDTETLCIEAEDLIQQNGYRTVLDLCCGSGCIGIALQKRTGVSSVTSVDIDERCVELTKENAELNESMLTIKQGDLFTPVSGLQFDLICCNPPYLTAEDMESLQKEVTFEPKLALFGGEDGLDFYRRIAAEYRTYLHPDGALVMEIGCNQGEAVLNLFPGSKLKNDLNGNPRVVVCRRSREDTL